MKKTRRWKYVYPTGPKKGQTEQGVYCCPLATDTPGKPRLIVKYNSVERYTDADGLPMYEIAAAKRVRASLVTEQQQRAAGKIPEEMHQMLFRDAVHSLTKGLDAPLVVDGENGSGEKKYRSVTPRLETVPVWMLVRHLGEVQLQDFKDADHLNGYIYVRKQRQKAGVKSDGKTPYYRDGVGNNTLRKDLMTLCVLFDYFVQRKLCEKNFARETIDKFQLAPKQQHPGRDASRVALSELQLAAYRLAAWDVYRVDRRAMPVFIGSYTGERQTEIQRIQRKWMKLKIRKKHILIPPNTEDRRTQKSDSFSRDRRVWIDDELAPYLTEYINSVPSASGHLVSAGDRLIDDERGKQVEERLKKMHRRIFRRAVKLVPTEWFSVNSLRHTVGTNFFRQTLPVGVTMGDWLKAVANHMGHSPEMLVKKYVHIEDTIDLFGRGDEIEDEEPLQVCGNPTELLAVLTRYERAGAPPKAVEVLRKWATAALKSAPPTRK